VRKELDLPAAAVRSLLVVRENWTKEGEKEEREKKKKRKEKKREKKKKDRNFPKLENFQGEK
jgi:hypothetical protein